MTRRVLLVALAVLTVLSGVAPVAAAAGIGVDAPLQQSGTNTPTATPTPGNSTASAAGGGNGSVTLAEQARITAVQFDKDYLRTEAAGGSDDTYNTTGPYAVFATSEEVVAARIKQTPADAKVMDGGHTVKVTYDPDAAPADTASYYVLELFFRDDSKRSIQLYAQRTDQYVAPSRMKEAGEFLDEMREDAEAHGFPTDIEGLEDYHDWEKKQADLFNDLFGPQLAKLLGWFLVTVQTPFALMLLAAVGILIFWRMLKVHGWKVRSMMKGENTARKQRRDMIRAYERQRTAADEERLEDLDVIGPAYIYWQDAFDVSSTKQLADLFALGRPQRDAGGSIVRDTTADPVRDGEGEVLTHPDGEPVYPPVMDHHGIEDLLAADDVRETWLEPVLRPDMLGDSQSALAHAKRALLRMTTKYGQAEYEQALAEVTTLLEAVASGERYQSPSMPSNPTTPGRGALPGAGGGD